MKIHWRLVLMLNSELTLNDNLVNCDQPLHESFGYDMMTSKVLKFEIIIILIHLLFTPEGYIKDGKNFLLRKSA